MSRRVYFIKPVGMDGPVKVGCSMSPDNRRKTLAAWSPFPLEIIAEVEGDCDLERRFHALFVETHQRREWFGWSRRIAATVAAINDGTFDAATLPTPIMVCHLVAGVRSPRARKGFSPARRFSSAYMARMRALKNLGMPWSEYCAGPSFCSFAYDGGDYAHRHPRAADPVALIRACEAFADQQTAKYGHAKMKPLRWQGPFPEPLSTHLRNSTEPSPLTSAEGRA